MATSTTTTTTFEKTGDWNTIIDSENVRLDLEDGEITMEIDNDNVSIIIEEDDNELLSDKCENDKNPQQQISKREKHATFKRRDVSPHLRYYNLRYVRAMLQSRNNIVKSFVVATRYVQLSNKETVVISVGVNDTFNTREIRGMPYVMTKRNNNNRDYEGNLEFRRIHSKLDTSLRKMKECGVSNKVITMLQKDIRTNRNYENHCAVNPSELLEFITRECVRTGGVEIPLIVTWQNTRDMDFMKRCIRIDPKNMYTCAFCRLSNNTFKGYPFYGYILYGGSDREHIIVCNNTKHLRDIDVRRVIGLINPLWINMRTKREDNDMFVLELVYDNTHVLFRRELGVVDTIKEQLNIDEVHNFFCKESHGNSKHLSNYLQYIRCIFNRSL